MATNPPSKFAFKKCDLLEAEKRLKAHADFLKSREKRLGVPSSPGSPGSPGSPESCPVTWGSLGKQLRMFKVTWDTMIPKTPKL